MSKGGVMAYRKILVAIDREQTSDVIEKAIQIAGGDRSKIYLIHINAPLILDDMINGEITFPIELEEELLNSTQSWLKGIANQYQIPEQNCLLSEGDTSDGIIENANDIECDLIVVGNHEKHGLLRLFGSLTDSILHRIKCDLLAVHIN